MGRKSVKTGLSLSQLELINIKNRSYEGCAHYAGEASRTKDFTLPSAP